MQLNGTLRKRKRRNIAKVNGLTLVDSYNLSDTSIRINQLARNETQNDSPFHIHRITRDPSYHTIGIDGDFTPKSASNNDIPAAKHDRPYFLDSATMSRLKQILLLAICSGTVPWRFNSKTHKIDRWTPKYERYWRIQWCVVTFQTLCLTMYQIHTFFSRMKELQADSNREMFMASVSVYWYVCAVYFNINMYIYEEKIRQYINTLFRFNHDCVEKYVINLDGYEDGGRLVINLSIPSNTSQVFASVCLFLVLPYQPWYLFSYIYPKPWYYLIPGALHEFMLVGQVITNYILYQWIMVAHSNSLEFWLREMHNHNDSDYTRDSLREINESIKCYRKLQVMCSCFNECMSPLAIPMLKTHIFTGLVPCGYVVIRSLNQRFIDEFPGILTYPICVIDCATAGFTVLALASEVFDLAAGFLDSWSRSNKKEFRRVLRSCPALKVWVGRWYFITVATTITFFKVTTDIIIDAIIAFPE